jgi:hypothetical protein
MDIYSLTPEWFEWVVSAMADMTIRMAKQPAGKPPGSWQAFLGGGSPATKPAAKPRAPRKPRPKPTTGS